MGFQNISDHTGVYFNHAVALPFDLFHHSASRLPSALTSASPTNTQLASVLLLPPSVKGMLAVKDAVPLPDHAMMAPEVLRCHSRSCFPSALKSAAPTTFHVRSVPGLPPRVRHVGKDLSCLMRWLRGWATPR